MKSLHSLLSAFVLCLMSKALCAQNDSINQKNKAYGNYSHDQISKALTIDKPSVIVFKGDSIYSLSQYDLKQLDGRHTTISIIKHPDSVAAYLRKKVTALIIIESQKDK